jgi:LPPG:FO 2-phospho-L-lactate transferase
MTRVVALAGGVGGAKLAAGLSAILSPDDLTVVVNTGDDFELFGLKISPDIDTVCYTLAGLANPDTGWGRNDETWNTLKALKELGAPTWFALGDSDLALHLERTRLRNEGLLLSEITRQLCARLKVSPLVLPMTDDPVSTIVSTREYGDLSFQEYFVKYHFVPSVTGIKFNGVETAHAPRLVVDKLEEADVILICPSNPWVSIAPILSVKEIKQVVSRRKAVAVSPIIGGKALKGPAAKMYEEMGIVPSAFEVARHYREVLKGFVLDAIDAGQKEKIEQCGIISLTTNTIMASNEDRIRLAREVLEFSNHL